MLGLAEPSLYARLTTDEETDCCGAGWAQIGVPSPIMTGSGVQLNGEYKYPVSVRRRFPCTALVTETYRINARMVNPGSVITVEHATLILQYSPN